MTHLLRESRDLPATFLRPSQQAYVIDPDMHASQGTCGSLSQCIRLGLTITQLNRKVNDDDTNISGKEYKSDKVKVLIARALGLPAWTHVSRDLPIMEIT